jgi:hypothetical protein
MWTAHVHDGVLARSGGAKRHLQRRLAGGGTAGRQVLDAAGPPPAQFGDDGLACTSDVASAVPSRPPPLPAERPLPRRRDLRFRPGCGDRGPEHGTSEIQIRHQQRERNKIIVARAA